MAVWAIGLMSGTSMDGVDAALIETDGERVFSFGPALTLPYPESMKPALRAALGAMPKNGLKPHDAGAMTTDLRALERALTLLQGDVVAMLLQKAPDISPQVVGFHGQTINHRPDLGWTWQLGDGQLLANRLNLPVVYDFRRADVDAGGEGAPFAPVFHRALAKDMAKPLAVLNLGGVGNVTWISDGQGSQEDMVAFDTGPGNAMLDDWVRQRANLPFDVDGSLALRGEVSTTALARLMDHAYFAKGYPKSLDRNAFAPDPVADLSAEDGAATLVAFTVQSVAASLDLLPEPPKEWLVTGGGRHNQGIMQGLARALKVPVRAVEDVGWDGDALEAQAFAYLAVRSLNQSALSFPSTTGVRKPCPGGQIAKP